MTQAHRHTGVDSPRIKNDDIDGTMPTGSDEVKLTGDQTVAGIKTFTSIPVLPASNPTTSNQMTRKAYADSITPPTFVITASATQIDIANDVDQHTSLTPFKAKEIQYNEANGTITTSFALAQLDSFSNGSLGQIYVNGSAVGTQRSTGSDTYVTYTEDITVVTGDLVQLYVWRSASASRVNCKDLKLFYQKTLDTVAGTINLD